MEGHLLWIVALLQTTCDTMADLINVTTKAPIAAVPVQGRGLNSPVIVVMPFRQPSAAQPSSSRTAVPVLPVQQRAPLFKPNDDLESVSSIVPGSSLPVVVPRQSVLFSQPQSTLLGSRRLHEFSVPQTTRLWGVSQMRPIPRSRSKSRSRSVARLVPDAFQPQPLQKVYQVVRTWSKWGAWSECSQRCGGGEQVRVKECRAKANYRYTSDAYARDSTVTTCSGTVEDRRTCNTQCCQGEWGRWSAWIDYGGQQRRLRYCCGGGSCNGDSTQRRQPVSTRQRSPRLGAHRARSRVVF